jgi:hypothetical protein
VAANPERPLLEIEEKDRSAMADDERLNTRLRMSGQTR